ncbi:2-oxo acid dehydrogenase subunit E2 [Rhodovulum sp. 12E13]|uniref:dihydrolipoamide acetyltransferase family protein n=1 Tax=Rhodovulum sp. 12E13 TaxID=2203891 RepID=UPI000E11FFE9|nr:dihydrolipoamide acetyltransferase family protein [Rhodovulum sp. 12E13]RDC75333.1 2-oxo acid dehydrogenase subunit E2 [Rhodovulum sp. 12E13]
MGIFVMPSLGSDMESGKLVEWLVTPGEAVQRGDVVAVVETQKGAIEIETFEAGRVESLTAEPGQTLAVGAPMAVILAEGESAPAPAPASTPAPAPAPASTPAQTGAAEAETTAPAQPPPAEPRRPERPPAPAARDEAPAETGTTAGRASPAARSLARERGIDLAGLRGSGPGGAILLSDVEAAGAPRGERAAAQPAPGRIDMAEMRKAIAAAMSRSKRTIPHFYLSQTIDIEALSSSLETDNALRAPADRILLGAAFVRAAVVAAQAVPGLNGHYDDAEGFEQAESVNAGVAIALRGGGLVAPALIDAGTLDLAATMQGMRDLVGRARAGRLRNSEMTQGTITVSSLGESGAEAMAGVIFPPQVALVGFGAPQRRPWVVGNAVVPRRTVTVTLSVDHRVSDGRGANRFLAALADALQSPETP